MKRLTNDELDLLEKNHRELVGGHWYYNLNDEAIKTTAKQVDPIVLQVDCSFRAQAEHLANLHNVFLLMHKEIIESRKLIGGLLTDIEEVAEAAELIERMSNHADARLHIFDKEMNV